MAQTAAGAESAVTEIPLTARMKAQADYLESWPVTSDATVQLLREGADRIEALEAETPVRAAVGALAERAIAVKPLVWKGDTSVSIAGIYRVFKLIAGDDWAFGVNGIANRWEVYPTIEAAKAAAQADYERRVMSALTVEPGHDHSPDAGKMVPTHEGLSLAALREANQARQGEWDEAQVLSLAFAATELAGETGEVCNVVKKLERERLGLRGSRATKAQLAEELADVVICADLVARHEGIDLSEAVIGKFNATSEKHGFRTCLAKINASV